MTLKPRLGMADYSWAARLRAAQPMFIFLGIAIGAYTAFAACTGNVYARSRFGGRVIVREESPWYFWSVIACYVLLAIALVTVF